MIEKRLIELDSFSFEFLSEVGQRESWRKEVHRPIYHVHKWWAKRLGSVFRGILLGSALPSERNLVAEFYELHDFSHLTVFDPFLGSGTTVGEAHKLGFTALGRDINPVAVEAVRVALSSMDRIDLEREFRSLAAGPGEALRSLYATTDSDGNDAEVLYYFWVMLASCPDCGVSVDLFSSYVFSRNAYPARKPAIQVVCPICGDVFPSTHGSRVVKCTANHEFDPEAAPASGATATCTGCHSAFSIKQALGGKRPDYRMYAKMILRRDGEKEYIRATAADLAAYSRASALLDEAGFDLPELALSPGHNTKQAMAYGFNRWVDFFNRRQLYALCLLRKSIAQIEDRGARESLLLLFSGVLEFNNMFASFKGEGTGAVRHMFSHHILKPERTPIEANLWGTPRSSGSFSGLFKSRLLKAVDYLENPTEVAVGSGGRPVVCSAPFSRELSEWALPLPPRAVAITCGDSANTLLPSKSVDLIVTDPPFFDNVHYSELADFFEAWRNLGAQSESTRREAEVQDGDIDRFTAKLGGVFTECARILREDGLLVFTYHHSRDEGWRAVAEAIISAGLYVVNAHPVKAELSVATPKSQAKEPIQLDTIIVCRRAPADAPAPGVDEADSVAALKVSRMRAAGFDLSKGDLKVIGLGQRLTCVRSTEELWLLDRETSGKSAVGTS